MRIVQALVLGIAAVFGIYGIVTGWRDILRAVRDEREERRAKVAWSHRRGE